MADYTEGSAPRAPVRAGALVNYAGAAVSLGLMIGVAVWGVVSRRTTPAS